MIGEWFAGAAVVVVELAAGFVVVVVVAVFELHAAAATSVAMTATNPNRLRIVASLIPSPHASGVCHLSPVECTLFAGSRTDGSGHGGDLFSS